MDALPPHLILATWNVEWAVPSKRDAIAARLGRMDAEVLVVTEGDRSVLPGLGPDALDGGDDWGYANTKPGWRKVLLSSRGAPLRPAAGLDGPPGIPGRFVAADVSTSLGDVRVLAVCIPWKDAHVRTGRRDVAPWDEHRRYVEWLGDAIRANRDRPLVVMGDFNQRLPRTTAPVDVHGALMDALDGLTVATAGHVPGLSRQDVDHIAVSSHFEVSRVRGIDRHDRDGRRLSDHDAVMAVLRLHD